MLTLILVLGVYQKVNLKRYSNDIKRNPMITEVLTIAEKWKQCELISLICAEM